MDNEQNDTNAMIYRLGVSPGTSTDHSRVLMWYEYDQSEESNGKTAFVAKKNHADIHFKKMLS
jgi:hypothetical protein